MFMLGEFSRTSKSSLTDVQESVTPTGPNGWKLKLNQIQFTSVSREIQFVSFQDVSHPSATTSTQAKDTLATRRLRHAAQLESRDTNGELENWMHLFQT